MKKILLSVIIPIYNSQIWLEECLNSIINQTKIANIEILCVNDGSSDNSLNILKKYQLKYPFIKIINQENKGAGCARNNALKSALGEYICFVDSDDFVSCDLFSYCFSEIEKFSDVIIFGAKTYNSKTKNSSTGNILLNILKENLSAKTCFLIMAFVGINFIKRIF